MAGRVDGKREAGVTMPSLSIIVATRGRSTLETLLHELVSQTESGDEIIVVSDGPNPASRRFAGTLGPKVRYVEYGPVRCWGHPQRDIGMRLASKEYLSFLNDDDMVVPSYVRSLKAVAAENPGRPIVFRMQMGPMILWGRPGVFHGNVSTQMLVLPNVQERLGNWGRSYQGDFIFMKSTMAKYPEGDKVIVWNETVTVMHGHRWSPAPRLHGPGTSVPSDVFRSILGMISEDEESQDLAFLNFVAKFGSFGELVEIGVGRGRSTLALLAGAREAGRILYSYDIDSGTKQNITSLVKATSEKSILDSWVFRQLPSAQAADDFPPGSIGLLYIDTSHLYEDLRDDLATWLPKMHPDGIICGADYALKKESEDIEKEGVYRAVQEFLKENDHWYKLIAPKSRRGLFVFWPHVFLGQGYGEPAGMPW